ncbi:MAG: DUF4962 domain-containing protein, partial [Chitinivibrionales bacterium]|nr:DUF4962 domain-containing protein [Chitinivibrionales bacterium]
SWYLDRAHQAYGHYIGDPVNVDAGWKDYLFGFWGQFAMNMFWIVEEDTVAARTAREWALHYAGRGDWLADDLIPMDILSGMAITYDIQYDNFSAAERSELRTALKAAIDFMYPEFFIGEYWTNDFQNNHLHNRVHGFANACFAIYGDDPGMDLQTEADLALGCFEDIVEWLPADGSNHEGPGYWDYGNHWVVRLTHLMSHVTGTDYAARNEHFAQDYYFRLYMTAPGWQHTFGIGDANEGAPSNITAWALPIAEQADARATAVLRTLMRTVSGGFYQHVAWGLLWYDGEITEEPYETLPLSRFWPDLEMLSVRSGWDSLATAFVFKCGPPGGHTMNRLASGWINVAHDHPDQNHFMLFAGGEMLAQDDGYPKEQKLARSHNTITVDGEGQTREGGAWYQPFDYAKTGFMEDVLLSGSSVYASGNASDLYTNADRFVRHAVFMEGEYVLIVDDLLAAGATEREWDWRLHCDGSWSDNGSGVYTVTKGDAALRTTMLAPSRHTASFLPAELTAKPCLSVAHRAEQTQFVALLEPDAAGATARLTQVLDIGPHVGVSVTGGDFTDVFLIAMDTGAVGGEAVSTDGVAAMVRRDDLGLKAAACVRATVMLDAADTLLACSRPANLVRRRLDDGALVEISPPYRDTGGTATLTIGSLPSGVEYAIAIDGVDAGSETAGESRCVTVDVQLDTLHTVRVLDASTALPIRPRIHAGSRMSVTVRGSDLHVVVSEVIQNAAVLVVSPSGRARRFRLHGNRLTVPSMAAGMYCVQMRQAGATQSCRVTVLPE